MAIIQSYNENLINVTMYQSGDLHIIERRCLSDLDTNPNYPDVAYKDTRIIIEAGDVKEFLRIASEYFAEFGEGREGNSE